MTNNAKQLLKEVAEHPNCLTGLKLIKSMQDKETLLAYKELLQLGYIEETGTAIDVLYFSITDAGISAANNS